MEKESNECTVMNEDYVNSISSVEFTSGKSTKLAITTR